MKAFINPLRSRFQRVAAWIAWIAPPPEMMASIYGIDWNGCGQERCGIRSAYWKMSNHRCRMSSLFGEETNK